MADLQDGAKAIRRLEDALRRSDGLPEAYAEAVLREAQSRARGRPTPQARMAAEAMVVSGPEIVSSTGGAPAEVAGGSEWGSSIYTQFAPRNEGGYWLMPATESRPALEAGDRYLERMVEESIRGFGV